MIMLGSFHAVIAFVSFFPDDYVAVTKAGLVIPVEYPLWGWVHLVLGAVAIAGGYAVISGHAWGRVIGVVMAVVGAVANMASLGAHPAWGVILIAVDLAVIYALTAHGREAKAYIGSSI
jgi:hypothetical protein